MAPFDPISAAAAGRTNIAFFTAALPTAFIPTETDVRTLWIVAIYAVAIAALWNIPYLRQLIYPCTDSRSTAS